MCVHCSKDDDVEWDSDSDGGGDDHDDNVLFYHYHFLDTPPKVADKLYWMEKQKKIKCCYKHLHFVLCAWPSAIVNCWICYLSIFTLSCIDHKFIFCKQNWFVVLLLERYWLAFLLISLVNWKPGQWADASCRFLVIYWKQRINEKHVFRI